MNLIWIDFDIHKTEIVKILKELDDEILLKKDGKIFYHGLLALQSLLLMKILSKFKKNKIDCIALKQAMRKIYEPFYNNFACCDLHGLFLIIKKLISQGLDQFYAKCLPISEPLHSLCYVYFSLNSRKFSDLSKDSANKIDEILKFHHKLVLDDTPCMPIINLLISYFKKFAPENIHMIWKFISSKDYYNRKRNNDWLLEVYLKLVPFTHAEKLDLIFNKDSIKFLYYSSQEKNPNHSFYVSFIGQINESRYPGFFPPIIFCLIINGSFEMANILFVMNKLITSLSSKISIEDINAVFKLTLDEKPMVEHFRITSCYYLLKFFLSAKKEAIRHFSFRCIEIYSKSSDVFYLSHFKLSLQFYCNFDDVDSTSKNLSELLKFVVESMYDKDPLPILNKIKELFDGIKDLKESKRYVFSLVAFASIAYDIESEELISCLADNLIDAVNLKKSCDPSWFCIVFDEILSLSISTYKSAFQFSNILLSRLSKYFNMTTLDVLFNILEDPKSVVIVNNEVNQTKQSQNKQCYNKQTSVSLIGKDMDISELDPEQASQIDDYLSQAFSSIKKSETTAVSTQSIIFVQNRIFGLLNTLEKNLTHAQLRFEISFRLLKLSSSKFYISNKEQFGKIQACILSFLSHDSHDDEKYKSEWVVSLLQKLCQCLKSLPVICFNESWAEFIIKLTVITSKLDDDKLALNTRKRLRRIMRKLIIRFMSNKRESINPEFFNRLYQSQPCLCQDRKVVTYFFSQVENIRCPKFKHDKLLTYWRYFIKNYKKSPEIVLKEIIKIVEKLHFKKCEKRNLSTIETIIQTSCRQYPLLKAKIGKHCCKKLLSSQETNTLQVRRVLKKIGL